MREVGSSGFSVEGPARKRERPRAKIPVFDGPVRGQPFWELKRRHR